MPHQPNQASTPVLSIRNQVYKGFWGSNNGGYNLAATPLSHVGPHRCITPGVTALDPAILAFSIFVVFALFLILGISTWKFATTLPQLKEESAEQKVASQSTAQAAPPSVEASSQTSLPVSFTAKTTAEPMPEVTVSFFAGPRADGLTKTASEPAKVNTASAQQAHSGSTSSTTAEASAKSQSESKTSATADPPANAESSATKTQAEETATATNGTPAEGPTSNDEPLDG